MGDADKDLAQLAKTATDDFYELLGVAFDAPEAAIKKAYRKASIKYHPDKNPDNKDAADRFIYLGWARDILLDATLKGEYDRARTRRREKALQDELLDGRRRQMKQDLERREREASLKRKRPDDLSEADKELQRIAEDGKRRRKERWEKKRQEEEEASMVDLAESQPQPQPPAPGQSADIDRTIKIRFQREGDMAQWDKDKLQAMFATYGNIEGVIPGKDKKIRPSGEKHRKVVATVFILFTRLDHAYAAVSNGKADHPTIDSVSWANGEPDFKAVGSIQEVAMIRLKEAGKKQLEEQMRKREAAQAAAAEPANVPSAAPATPISTPNKSFRASFGPGLGKGTGTPTGVPKFSFSPKTPAPAGRLREAEKKRLEEQIRKQEAAEEAAAKDAAA